MSSKRKQLALSHRRDLFDSENDTDESYHDPFSDVDGECGSDKNYEPDNAEGGESSESDYEIFTENRHRRMALIRVSESPSQLNDSSLNDDSPGSEEEIGEKSCDDQSVIEQSEEEDIMGTPKTLRTFPCHK
ncbi:unnamed protein product, partial [Brenthis ino]